MEEMAEEDKSLKLRIEVQDSGIGIKDEDIDKLFKMFGKIEQTENINSSGIGLGLTICNNILNQLGSELKVKSVYKQGTCFYFTLSLPYIEAPSASQIQINMLKSSKHL